MERDERKGSFGTSEFYGHGDEWGRKGEGRGRGGVGLVCKTTEDVGNGQSQRELIVLYISGFAIKAGRFAPFLVLVHL